MAIKIEALFNAYKEYLISTPDIDSIFSLSGMKNEYGQLDYGFFPLGHGILKDIAIKTSDAETQAGGIMVLGNDFGAISYLDGIRSLGREKESNSTIKNLHALHKKAFFTNFYMGIRTVGSNDDKFSQHSLFRDFCKGFFVKQLDLLQPRLVICLGKPVAAVLYEFYTDQFGLIGKNINYGKLFSAGNYLLDANIHNTGNRQFMFIPHPSWAHINWKKHQIEEKLLEVAVKY